MPYEGEIQEKDYYKTVYPQLRLGSMYLWEPHDGVTLPVHDNIRDSGAKTSSIAETSIATVRYKDEKKMDQNPGAVANVPFTEVPGILSYDKDLSVYIGIQFAEKAVTDEQVAAIAQSIVLMQ